MKELRLFQCEVCGTIYNNETERSACENFHVQPANIASCFFKSKNNCGAQYPYPYEIKCTMDNGEIVTYEYKGAKK